MHVSQHEEIVLNEICRQNCMSCGEDMTKIEWKGYRHDGGLNIIGKKVWYYKECKYCGYQNSWKKLELPQYYEGDGYDD